MLVSYQIFENPKKFQKNRLPPGKGSRQVIAHMKRSYARCRLSTHAFTSASELEARSTLPLSTFAPGQLGARICAVFPMELPPEVPKGTTVLPLKSQLSRNVSMMRGASYHQMESPRRRYRTARRTKASLPSRGARPCPASRSLSGSFYPSSQGPWPCRA